LLSNMHGIDSADAAYRSLLTKIISLKYNTTHDSTVNKNTALIAECT